MGSHAGRRKLSASSLAAWLCPVNSAISPKFSTNWRLLDRPNQFPRRLASFFSITGGPFITLIRDLPSNHDQGSIHNLSDFDRGTSRHLASLYVYISYHVKKSRFVQNENHGQSRGEKAFRCLEINM
jgi:hypothetical protein